jgi:hypothetical protein
MNLIKNIETLIDASKEAGLEIDVEKSKYILLSRHQNLGQNRDIKIQIIWKCVTVQMLGNYSNKSKFNSGGN